MKKRLSPPFLKGFDCLKVPLLDALGNSAWPIRFSREKIDEIKARSGPLKFNSQMLLIPPQSDSTFFDISLINLYDADLHVFQSNSADVYMLNDTKLNFGCVSWDPSLGKSNGDKSVIIALFKDEKNNCYIHDILNLTCQNAQNSAKIQCEQVIKFMQKNHLFNIVIETNGIGAFLSEILRDTATQINYPIFIKKINQTQNKNERIINNVQPILYSQSFYLKSNLTNSSLISEMEEFSILTQSNNDDTLDAVSSGLSANFGVLRRCTNMLNLRDKKVFNAKTNFSI